MVQKNVWNPIFEIRETNRHYNAQNNTLCRCSTENKRSDARKINCFWNYISLNNENGNDTSKLFSSYQGCFYLNSTIDIPNESVLLPGGLGGKQVFFFFNVQPFLIPFFEKRGSGKPASVRVFLTVEYYIILVLERNYKPRKSTKVLYFQ